ncbi:MAG: hypothetical protein J6S85_18130 [Methanobrevibacter sp.]|nr:hypothetical protein [Methanobrevibacter sp.]
MQNQNLLEELINSGLEERLRKDRLSMYEEIKREIFQMIDSSNDDKEIIKNIVKYLTDSQFRYFSRNRY